MEGLDSAAFAAKRINILMFLAGGSSFNQRLYIDFQINSRGDLVEKGSAG
jgi:hypothetical protein